MSSAYRWNDSTRCSRHSTIDSGGDLKPGTIAEGIAVKSPGAITLPVIRAQVDDVLEVSEETVEQAVFRLIEIEKTVVEGAGAVGLAAVMADPAQFDDQKTVLVLSGGNLDMMILASILQRGMVRSGRFVRLQVEIPDVPGAWPS